MSNIFSSYEESGIKDELDKITEQSVQGDGNKMAGGLKIAKEKLFDETARDWVYQVFIYQQSFFVLFFICFENTTFIKIHKFSPYF